MKGTCHYLEGNMGAERRVAYTKKLLAEVGLEPERLEMFFLSAAEGVRFAEIATEMTERARALGPNPLRSRSGTDSADPSEKSKHAIQDQTTR
jgi:F420-non-reducing hydrogenase iron-sulfur subunit